MLATFGLDRLEASLHVDAAPSDGVDELVEQAKVEPVRRPQPVPDTGPLRALRHREVSGDHYAFAQSEAYLPTRDYAHHTPNPQFQPTRQADRV